MTRKKLRNIYQYSTLAVLTVLSFPLTTLLNLEPKWYHFIVIYLVSTVIGGFLYTYFSGVMVHSVQFIGDANAADQEFVLEFQIGFSPHHTVQGKLDNTIGLKEDELAQLFYGTITKHIIMPTLKRNEQQTIYLQHKQEQIVVQIG